MAKIISFSRERGVFPLFVSPDLAASAQARVRLDAPVSRDELANALAGFFGDSPVELDAAAPMWAPGGCDPSMASWCDRKTASDRWTVYLVARTGAAATALCNAAA